MVKIVTSTSASASKSNESVGSASSNILSSSFLKAAGFFGIGALGFSVFKFDTFPLSFYATCLVISILLYNSSSYMISRLSNHAKISSVVGVAALNGPGTAFFVVFSTFAALFVMAGISFSLTCFSTFEVLHNLKTNVANWLVALGLGILYMSAILFYNKRAILFPWARYGFITIILGMTIAKSITQSDEIIEYIAQSFKDPSFAISFAGIQEFSTAVCIFLLCFFTGSILDTSILKAKSESKERKSAYSDVIIGLISSIIAFIFMMLLLIVQRGGFIPGFFDNSIFSNIYLKTPVGILLIISLAIQSIEYFDSAHTIVFGFFKPLFKKELKSLEVIYIREALLIAWMFSVSYYAYGRYSVEKGIFNVANYVLCFAISVSFLIIPSLGLIKRSQKLSGGLSIGAWLTCILCGIIGIGLIIIYLFGLGSLQRSTITELMLENLKNVFFMLIICTIIYTLFVILDAFFYPPKNMYPLNHRTINSSDAPVYGNNYAAEVLIILCVVATLLSLLNVIYWPSSNFIESSILHFVELILRIFIHADIIHLVFNSLSIYGFGKKLSVQVGPCHFVCFFLVAGILAQLLESIFNAHIYGHKIIGIGASGVVYALLGRYLFIEGITFKMWCFQVTSHEFVVYSVVLSIFSILSGLLRTIGHTNHLAGLIIGMFFWDISNRLWEFRGPVHKRFFARKK